MKRFILTCILLFSLLIGGQIYGKTTTKKKTKSTTTQTTSKTISPYGHSYRLSGSERKITMVFNGKGTGKLEFISMGEPASTPFDWVLNGKIVCITHCPVIPDACLTLSPDGKTLTDKNQVLKRID